MPVIGMAPIHIDLDQQPAAICFKHPVEKVAGRQSGAENKLMKLGGNIDEVLKGKKPDSENVNCKGTHASDMYLLEKINMMHRRVKDEYPAYAKDGSFERAIEDPGTSPKKFTDYLAKRAPNN